MIDFEINDGIATLVMNHGRVNAMSLEFLTEFNNQLSELAENQSVQQLVIAGNERVFSAGVDLKRIVAEDEKYLDRFLPELTGLFRNVFEFDKPVIAAITGHAVAGGCVLACAADYRVISDQARIGVPELRVGVPFPCSGMELMRWTATLPAFRQMINTGATFTGGEAVTAGLADEMALHDDVCRVAHMATEPFSVVPQEVFRLTKRQMRQPVLDQIDCSEQLFGEEIQRLWRAPETRTSIADYVAERLR